MPGSASTDVPAPGVADAAASAVPALQKALQAVSNPLAYASTGDGHLPLARDALVKRAKAMTGLYLFEIEGLIRATVRAREKGIVDVASMVHAAWLRWLQLHGQQAQVVVPMDGRLVSEFPKRSGQTTPSFLPP